MPLLPSRLASLVPATVVPLPRNRSHPGIQPLQPLPPLAAVGHQPLFAPRRHGIQPLQPLFPLAAATLLPLQPGLFRVVCTDAFDESVMDNLV